VSSGQSRTAIGSELARLLKEARKKQRLSLTVLAERSGVSRQAISYIEREKQSPAVDTLVRICAVLGVKLEKLFAEARKRAGG
jgi:transcriptional regulator with XRE-family HTH domain